MIDFSRPVQTRDGREVRILCTDRLNRNFPVVGLVKISETDEMSTYYTLEGRSSYAFSSDLDLVNVPSIFKEIYTNIYEDGSSVTHSTFDQADLGKGFGTHPLFLGRRHDIWWTDGRFETVFYPKGSLDE